ncbi:hypothetical protein GDO81_029123 [Engystomops pustulosus]|uniref:Uncharacterized protein n=1 Tax=Engystomops pustulosus TaxID=76066 RepID=A0AAV6ZFT7_ENGPU|nr:hypothetical protein GDO81_029123 [Engystomops pustulosus]
MPSPQIKLTSCGVKLVRQEKLTDHHHETDRPCPRLPPCIHCYREVIKMYGMYEHLRRVL